MIRLQSRFQETQRSFQTFQQKIEQLEAAKEQWNDEQQQALASQLQPLIDANSLLRQQLDAHKL